MNCPALAARIADLQPDATPRDVARLCLLMINSVEDITSLDDEEILELEFADNPKPKKSPSSETRRKVQPKKARSGGPSVKAPPLPPSLNKNEKSANSGTLKKGGLSADGEEEFWQLVDD